MAKRPGLSDRSLAWGAVLGAFCTAGLLLRKTRGRT